MATEKRLIDANDALEQLKQAEKEMKVVTPLGCKAVDIRAVLRYIESRPTVDAVEVVHGRWENHDWNGVKVKGFMTCSVCNVMIPTADDNYYCLLKLNYCPNCGAKMDGDGNG